MRATLLIRYALTCALGAGLTALPQRADAQASPYRGLWVGAASLSAVNEVSVPLNAANVPVAPHPERPTPTFDRAELRLLIHVNGAGQAFLLKDVAILNRVHGQNTNNVIGYATETDLSLVTDPRLYAVFPPQPAQRLASAVFDFGDAKATEALDALVESAAQQAMIFATTSTFSLVTQGDRVQARNAAVALIEPALTTQADHADVAEAFNQFLLQFTSAALGLIVANSSDPVVATLSNAAVQVRDQSVYGDTRALDMLQAVLDAVAAAAPTGQLKAAHHTASSFADVGNLYQRFISGAAFGDMVAACALSAATAATQALATAGTIELALRDEPETVAALTAALQAKVQMYDDTRSTEAVDAVLAAMAAEALASAALTASEIAEAAAAAGRAELADQVARYPLPVLTPTVDYNLFVDTPVFAAAPAAAAAAAAQAAIDERATNPLYTELSVYNAARVAAVNALSAAYSEAARVMRTELPLAGEFAPGSGDARPVSELAQPSDLGAAGLQGRIYLPASHPTNPFRHRRHPDHTMGFNIERVIRLDFDGAPGDALSTASLGVERITGTYREEIFGLHKPLGPEPVTQPVGLRTEGRFELNRISLIDTLNTL